jgi:SAM-dependent methyltransferase
MASVIEASPTAIQELHALFSAIGSEWAQTADPRKNYTGGFDTPEKIANLWNMYAGMLGAVDDLAQTTGCDLGCWFGFSTQVMAALGPRRVYGVDIMKATIEVAQAYRATHGLDQVEFKGMDDGIVSLDGDTVDWVVMNQVLCNALVGTTEQVLYESYRILNSGGLLALCDSNNLHCPATAERLVPHFRRLELGEGTPEMPSGPNNSNRMKLIKRLRPQVDPEFVPRLARETCYMGRVEILESVDRFLADGSWPGSVFRDGLLKSTIGPGNDYAQGNINDPIVLSEQLKKIGYDNIVITCSPVYVELDKDVLWSQLRSSPGFYLFARKP